MTEYDLIQDPEFRRQLAAMGAIPDEQALINKEMDLGTEMAQTPLAEGTRVGHTYIAASPMSHLAVALQRYMGMRQQKQAREGMRNAFGKLTSARSNAMDRWAQMQAPEQGPGPFSGQAPQLIE